MKFLSSTIPSAGKRLLAQQGAVRCMATQPPLTVELPGVESPPALDMSVKPETKVTTLSNGLRVASRETFNFASSIAVVTDAGSQYETDHNNGISNFLSKMAFKSTENRSHLRFVRDLEDIGAQASSEAARDFVQYSVDVLRPNAEGAMDLLSDTILRPKFAPWDMEEERKVLKFEREEINADPGQVINELLHEAAFGDSSPLGRSRFCPERNDPFMGEELLREYVGAHFSAKRTVIGAAGIEHERLVELAEKYFGDMPADVVGGAPQLPPSKYRGGDRRVRENSPLTHLALSFDGGSWKSDDLAEVCVLNMLLGGGGSFSAGGPGKGMYSRLFTNVLNQYGWVESCSAFNSLYADAGLVGIYGACLPQQAGAFVDVMAGELKSLANQAPNAEETQRAKNQLLSAIMTSLDGRTSVAEDIGRQFLIYGEWKSAETLRKDVEGVTAEGIQKAAQKALSTPVTLAAYGDVSTIPDIDAISSKFK